MVEDEASAEGVKRKKGSRWLLTPTMKGRE